MSAAPIGTRLKRLLGIQGAGSRQKLSVLLWSLFVALLVGTGFVLGWFERIELRTIDWRGRLHPPAQDSHPARIAIVVVTEDDLRRLNESWPLPRERYAQLVDALHRQQAAVIAFDMALPPAPRSTAGDLLLAGACERAANVVLAAYSPQAPASLRQGYNPRLGTYDVAQMIGNAPAVTRAARATGHLNIFTDCDGTVRRAPALIRHQGTPLLSLGAAAAALYTTGQTAPSPRLREAMDQDGCLWITYRDPRHAIDLREDGGLLRQAGIDLRRPIELYSLSEALSKGSEPPGDLFAGRIVLIGCALNGFGSAQHTTPFGNQHGVFVQAAILDTALNGAPWRRIPQEAGVAVTALIALLCGMFFSRLEGHATAVWYVIITALVIGAAMFTFKQYGLILDLAPPLIAVALSCAGALLIGLGIARVEVAKRNRELDAILEAGTASVGLVGPELTGQHPLDVSAPGARIIGEAVIPETTPQIVANTVGQAMRAGGCFLFLPDPEGEELAPAAAYGFRAGPDKGLCAAAADRLNRHVLEAGRPVLVQHPHTDIPGADLPPQVRSLLLVPLAIGGETLGTIQLFNKVPLMPGDDGRFRQDDLRTATILGCQSAVSLQNARLYLERHDLFLDFVEAIATSVDLKDRYTHGHSKRVAEHSAGIAAELGFSGAAVELVALAARLHDVGKIGTPDLLLRKRGRLTQQEFEVVKAHVTSPDRLFNGKPGWETLVPGIRHHHERYNSTGYPDGLRGDRIPLVARIIAVADAFDAMTSDRPYRRCMDPAEACEEIKACSGTQFDPRIAAAFLRYYRKRCGTVPPPRRRATAPCRPLGVGVN